MFLLQTARYSDCQHKAVSKALLSIVGYGPIQLAYAYHKAQLLQSLHSIRRPHERCAPPFALFKGIKHE